MEKLTSWEDMSELEQAQCIYWDLFKDAHNFRPRGIDTSSWSLDDFEQEFKSLGKIIKAKDEQRRQDEASAIERFEAQIASLKSVGAVSREAAVKWIHEAEETNGDDEYLCYCLGLPYGYFRKLEAA